MSFKSHMVVFDVVTPFSHAVLVASMHGAVDIARPRHLYPYALLAVPLPDDAVTGLFFASSVRHFSNDVGARGSVGLHGACGLLYAAGWCDVSFALMSLYFCALHTPLAYVGMIRRREFFCFALGLLLSTLCAWILALMPTLVGPHMQITTIMQRVVLCHILADESARIAAATAETED